MVDKPEMHPVVQFLLARMESHPEEFGCDGEGRWQEWIYRMRPLLTPDERIALRGPEMDRIHSQVLDELMNGEERRKELEAQKARERIALQRAVYGQQAQASTLGVLQNAIPTGIVNNALQRAASLQLGDETLDASTLAKIKRMLGL